MTLSNNISVIPWQSVLMVEETGVPRKNHRPATSYWQTQSYNIISSTPRNERGSKSQFYWWKALIAYVVLNPTTYTITITTAAHNTYRNKLVVKCK